MKLSRIVSALDLEFNVEETRDDWSFMFDPKFVRKSLPTFRKPNHHTGLLIKNSEDVNKIYTAFAPSTYVLEEIHMRGITGCLLIVKHPFDWDGRRSGTGFQPFTERDYSLMEAMGLSIYSLHTPLDRNRNDEIVSTAYAFAKQIKLKVEKEFAEEESNPGLYLGLIGSVREKSLDEFIKRLNTTLEYKVKTRKKNDLTGKVAVVTGGGFVPSIIQEAHDLGVNTYITGIITYNASTYDKKTYPKKVDAIKKIDINIIGASHYLTEKWALVFSLPYFNRFCKSEFIEDKEALKKLE